MGIRRVVREGMVSVQHDAGPYERVLAGGKFNDAGAIGHMNQRESRGRVPVRDGGPAEIARVGFRVPDMLIVGISKMRHEAFEAQRRAEFRLGRRSGSSCGSTPNRPIPVSILM